MRELEEHHGGGRPEHAGEVLRRVRAERRVGEVHLKTRDFFKLFCGCFRKSAAKFYQVPHNFLSMFLRNFLSLKEKRKKKKTFSLFITSAFIFNAHYTWVKRHCRWLLVLVEVCLANLHVPLHRFPDSTLLSRSTYERSFAEKMSRKISSPMWAKKTRYEERKH